MGFLDSLKEGLGKTRQGLVGRVSEIITGHKPIDEDLYDELEEALLQADVGVTTAIKLVETLKKHAKELKFEEAGQLHEVLKEEISRLLAEGDHRLNLEKGRLNVFIMVGVNGVGKTTTIGKLSCRLKDEGYQVLIAAADTFRAAASEQLKIWSQRAAVDIVAHKEGADPAAVVYDSLQAARSREKDVLIIDTAGRLQNKVNLMEELKKIIRVIKREVPDAPHEVLLVLDATTGQNALSQAKIFGQEVGVSGVVLTKLDGTAKGGVILGIQDEYALPVKLIGIGERIEDLQVFDPVSFSKALFSLKEE